MLYEILVSKTTKFTYNLNGWRDQLVRTTTIDEINDSTNYECFCYDEVGNPLVYNGSVLEWKKGRLLTKFGANTYTYNANGIRTSKTVGNVTTNFVLNGNKILSQSDTSGNTLNFQYGIDGITGFTYNGAQYFYQKNIQGDIIGILDKDFYPMIKYRYDAYGNFLCQILSTSGEWLDYNKEEEYNEKDTDKVNLSLINPFKYRGYYYDNETGFYYLNSRYYDPSICRFINADDIGILSQSKEFLNGLNLYAYCGNNPVMRTDSNGEAWWDWLLKIIGAVVVVVALGVASTFTGGAAGVIFGAAFYGAVTGAISSGLIGAVVGGVTGGWEGMLNGLADGLLTGAIIGGVTGALTSGLNIALGGVKNIGTAQKTGSLFHQFASNVQAGKMSLMIGKYSSISLNKKMGLQVYRPDIIGFMKNGMKVVEVVSSTQTFLSQAKKVATMMSNFPQVVSGLTLDFIRFIINWFNF